MRKLLTIKLNKRLSVSYRRLPDHAKALYKVGKKRDFFRTFHRCITNYDSSHPKLSLPLEDSAI